jgi:hypothetical protein
VPAARSTNANRPPKGCSRRAEPYDVRHEVRHGYHLGGRLRRGFLSGGGTAAASGLIGFPRSRFRPGAEPAGRAASSMLFVIFFEPEAGRCNLEAIGAGRWKCRAPGRRRMGKDMDQHLSEPFTVTQTIQLILAPGVMINACGLLILGISNKFSAVLNRIRVLNEERRRLKTRSRESAFTPLEARRLESVGSQLAVLVQRASLVRNALLCYFGAVGIFVATSLLIGLGFVSAALQFRYFVLGLFLAGMVAFLAGVVLAALDTLKGFTTMRYEIQSGD